MSEDNNNKGDGKRKRKNLSGRALFSNPKKEAEELRKSLSKNKNMDKELIKTPECLSWDMSIAFLAKKEWENIEHGTLDEKLAFGAFYGDIKLVDQCLELGADENFISTEKKSPVICLAACNKSYFVIQRLLECEDLNVLVKDSRGLCPSEISAMGEPNGDLTDILLKAEMKKAADEDLDFKEFLAQPTLEPPSI